MEKPSALYLLCIPFVKTTKGMTCQRTWFPFIPLSLDEVNNTLSKLQFSLKIPQQGTKQSPTVSDKFSALNTLETNNLPFILYYCFFILLLLPHFDHMVEEAFPLQYFEIADSVRVQIFPQADSAKLNAEEEF